MKEWIIKVVPYDLAAGTTTNFWFTQNDFVNSTGDGADQQYPARLIQPLRFTREVSAEGRIGGRSAPGKGEVIIDNSDGSFDGWTSDYAWDRRTVALYEGTQGDAFGSFTLKFQGVVENLEVTDSELVLRVMDEQYRMREQLLQTRVAEATGAEDGAPAPVRDGFGPIYQAPLSGSLEYQISNQGIDDASFFVYEGGVELTITTDYTVDESSGTVTMVSVPTFPVSFLYTQNAQISTVLWRLLDNAGILTVLDVDTNALSTFSSAANDGNGGACFNEDITAEEALDQMVNSLGGFYYFSTRGANVGQLVFVKFDAPSGAGDVTYSQNDIVGAPRRLPSSVPVWRVRIGYGANIDPLSESDIAASVTGADRADFVTRARFKTASDSTVQDNYPNAADVEIIGLLDPTSGAVAQDEADEQLALFKEPHDVMELEVPNVLFSRELHDVVALSSDMRMTGSVGADLYRVIGYTEDVATNMTTLRLWGGIGNGTWWDNLDENWDDIDVNWEDVG